MPLFSKPKMAIKEHDFVEIEYTGKLENGFIFDTTSEETAKKNNVYSEKAKYKPIIVCVGEKQLVPGLDQTLIGKEENSTFTITLKPEQAFGKKDAKLIRLVPLKTFQKQNIMPQPGLQLNIDGENTTILRVSGGRVLVDFNHPLSGKEIIYEVTIKRKVTDTEEQIKSFLELTLPIKFDVKVESEKATITTQHELPEQITNELAKKLKEITNIKEISFKKEEQKEILEKTAEEKPKTKAKKEKEQKA